MMRTGGLPGTYPDDRRAAAMPIATAAPPSWPVYRRHGPTPPAEAGSTKGATGRRQLPQSRNGGYRARRSPPAVASAAHTPTTPLRWRHTAVHVAKQRSCDPNGRPNGFPMDSQWIFNGCFFSIFFIIILESSRSQWIFFLMGPYHLKWNGRPNDFKWIFTELMLFF